MAHGSISNRGETRSSWVVIVASGCAGAAVALADVADGEVNLRIQILDLMGFRAQYRSTCNPPLLIIIMNQRQNICRNLCYWAILKVGFIVVFLQTGGTF
jgi:hypothetical protein